MKIIKDINEEELELIILFSPNFHAGVVHHHTVLPVHVLLLSYVTTHY
jgi:hypothetical protein